jgi:hypothetical protein
MQDDEAILLAGGHCYQRAVASTIRKGDWLLSPVEGVETGISIQVTEEPRLLAEDQVQLFLVATYTSEQASSSCCRSIRCT